MKFRMTTLAALMAWTCPLPAPLDAEPGPIGTWLMNEPVTLWDRGMDALEERAREAHERVGRAHEIAMYSGAYYDWDNNEISIVMAFSQVQESEVTHDGCNARRFVAITEISDLGRWWRESPRHVDIDGTGYGGEGEPPKTEWLTNKWIPDQVSGWFSHNGYRAGDRDEELGAKLARIIFVEVTMLTAPGEGISCRDRIPSRYEREYRCDRI